MIYGDVDFLLVDMPPGTGDVPLTVFQTMPVDGIIVVASPQELVGMIVEKACNMAKMMDVPVLSIVENFSYFKCPDCGKEHSIFGKSRLAETAAAHGVVCQDKLPVDPLLAEAVDNGKLEEANVPALPQTHRVSQNRTCMLFHGLMCLWLRNSGFALRQSRHLGTFRLME